MPDYNFGKLSETFLPTLKPPRNETAIIGRWLNELGLSYNPFDYSYLNADSDPQLHKYLIGHDQFKAMWQAQPTLVFAPHGGGKTAFRTRLAHACRMSQDGRVVFPILYKLPRPHHLTALSPDAHLTFINQAIAQELLLTLFYRPARYFNHKPQEHRQICLQLARHLPFNFEQRLNRLANSGNLKPFESFDSSIQSLFGLPNREAITRLSDSIRSQLPHVKAEAQQKVTPQEGFNQLIRLLKRTQGYQNIYLLVDEVDAHPETGNQPEASIALLRPLLQRISKWAREGIYCKLFLPESCTEHLTAHDLIDGSGNSLNIQLLNISWSRPRLRQIIQQRMHAASAGLFNSLDAISTPDLHGLIEDRILDSINHPHPREVLALIHRIFANHVNQAEVSDLLTLTNLELGIVRYKQHFRF